MNITIQDAKPEDVLGNSEVFYLTWLDTYPNEEYGISKKDIEIFFQNSKTAEVLEKKKKQIMNLPSNEKFLNAKDGERVVGVCRLIKHEDVGELKALYVLPEYQRMGIGKIFWTEALKFFSKDKDIIVKVAVYNEKALRFYKKLGFLDTGEIFVDDRFKMNSGSIIPETKLVINQASVI